MKTSLPADIDAYIAAFPPEVQARLQSVRAAIRAAAPEATEAISYAMPTFKLAGKNLLHFAAFKAHIGLYPTPNGLEVFAGELSKYKGGKGSVQFPLDAPMPLDLIRRIAIYRKENLAQKG